MTRFAMFELSSDEPIFIAVNQVAAVHNNPTPNLTTIRTAPADFVVVGDLEDVVRRLNEVGERGRSAVLDGSEGVLMAATDALAHDAFLPPACLAISRRVQVLRRDAAQRSADDLYNAALDDALRVVRLVLVEGVEND